MNDDGNGFSLLSLAETDALGYEPEAIECDLDGQSYSCYDIRLWKDDRSNNGLDALIRGWASAYGEFTSETEGLWVSTSEITCDGADCDDVRMPGFPSDLTMPCASVTTSPIYAL